MRRAQTRFRLTCLVERDGELRSMDVSIRHFRDTDQQHVRSFILAGMGERWGSIDETANPDIDDISTRYGPENFLVAFHKGVLVGTGGLIAESVSIVRVVRMWVARDLRRAGIGTQILNCLLDLAQERKYSRVVLETTSTWSDAISFYGKHGFIVEGIRGDEVHFYKDLLVET